MAQNPTAPSGKRTRSNGRPISDNPFRGISQDKGIALATKLGPTSLANYKEAGFDERLFPRFPEAAPQQEAPKAPAGTASQTKPGTA